MVLSFYLWVMVDITGFFLLELCGKGENNCVIIKTT